MLTSLARDAAHWIPGLFDQLGYGNAERSGDIEETLVEQSPVPVFDVDQYVAGDARVESQFFLSHSALDPQCADVAAHHGAPAFPLRHALRVVLTGSGRHAPQAVGASPQCLPY